MVSLHHLLLFLAAALLLLLTPGPAVFYIVARSVDQGRAAGLISVLGIELGNLVHVLAATLGLSALVMSSALAFSVVKDVGAVYLVYLGLRALFGREAMAQPSELRRLSFGRVFRQGILVAVLNPKTALFFLAFLPQFVDPAQGSVTAQLFCLGCLFVLMGTVTDGLYALLADSAGQRLKRVALFQRAERYVIASVYIGLGASAALAGGRHK